MSLDTMFERFVTVWNAGYSYGLRNGLLLGFGIGISITYLFFYLRSYRYEKR